MLDSIKSFVYCTSTMAAMVTITLMFEKYVNSLRYKLDLRNLFASLVRDERNLDSNFLFNLSSLLDLF